MRKIFSQDHAESLQSLKDSLREKSFLERTGRILIGIKDISLLLFQLKSGQSLVIDGDSGRIFRGRVNHSKLTELPQKLPGKMTGRDVPNIRTKWYVETKPKTWRDSWDGMLKIPSNIESLVGDIFQFLMENCLDEKIQKDFIKDSYGNDYVKVSIEGSNLSGWFSAKTGVLMYVEDSKNPGWENLIGIYYSVPVGKKTSQIVKI